MCRFISMLAWFRTSLSFINCVSFRRNGDWFRASDGFNYFIGVEAMYSEDESMECKRWKRKEWRMFESQEYVITSIRSSAIYQIISQICLNSLIWIGSALVCQKQNYKYEYVDLIVSQSWNSIPLYFNDRSIFKNSLHTFTCSYKQHNIGHTDSSNCKTNRHRQPEQNSIGSYGWERHIINFGTFPTLRFWTRSFQAFATDRFRNTNQTVHIGWFVVFLASPCVYTFVVCVCVILLTLYRFVFSLSPQLSRTQKPFHPYVRSSTAHTNLIAYTFKTKTPEYFRWMCNQYHFDVAGVLARHECVLRSRVRKCIQNTLW